MILRGNKVVHELATHVRTTKHSEVWFEDCPPWAQNSLAHELRRMDALAISCDSL